MIRMKRALRERIDTELEQMYPEEGGGFLLGVHDGAELIVYDVHPVRNVARSEDRSHRYSMTPADWMALEDDAEERGLTLLGYFHSHPDAPAVPSDFDREHALPYFRYLIVSVQARAAVEWRVWLLSPGRDRFEEEAFHVDG